MLSSSGTIRSTSRIARSRNWVIFSFEVSVYQGCELSALLPATVLMRLARVLMVLTTRALATSISDALKCA